MCLVERGISGCLIEDTGAGERAKQLLSNVAETIASCSQHSILHHMASQHALPCLSLTHHLTGLPVKEEFTTAIRGNFSFARGLEVVEAIEYTVISKQAVPGK